MGNMKKVTIKRPAPYVNVYKGTKIAHRYAIPQGDIYELTEKRFKGGCPVCLRVRIIAVS